MLEVLSSFDPPLKVVPINCPDGHAGAQPLADQPPVDIFELLSADRRQHAIALPKGARVAALASRGALDFSAREGPGALCFFAGANSDFFYGDKTS